MSSAMRSAAPPGSARLATSRHPYRQLHHLRVVAHAQRVILYDLYDQEVPYEEAWEWQRRLVDIVHEMSAGGGAAGAVLLLQHPPVYTLGAGATEAHLRFDPGAPPLPLFRTERGGEVTYHGPGQLVLYPMLDLRRFRQDLHWYLRSLEEVVIRALEEVSGLQGEREEGLTGVWVGGSKVAALGVRATRWVTYHGLALNVTTDLTPFRDIVPCGIAGRSVASVAGAMLAAARVEDPLAGDDLLAGEAYYHQPGSNDTDAREPPAEVSKEDLLRVFGGGATRSQAAAAAAGRRRLLEEYRHGLVMALEEVLDLEVEVVEGEEALEQLRRLAADERAFPATAAQQEPYR